MKQFSYLILLPLLYLPGCGRPEQKAPPQQVFDVPVLVGKSIRDVEAVLGPPAHASGPGEMERRQGLNDGFKTWRKDGASVIVQHDLLTGRIKYFYLAAGKDAVDSSFENEEEPLTIGNLKRNDARYRLKFIPNKDAPGKFWGLKAIPNN